MSVTDRAKDLAYCICERGMAFEDALESVSWLMRDNCYTGMWREIATGTQNGYVAFAVENGDAGMVRSICEYLNVDANWELAQMGI